MVSDPIADMLIRIKNAQMAKKKSALVPYSKIKWEIANVLSKYGFLAGVDRFGRKEKRVIEIRIKYDKDKNPRLSQIRRISKLSNRKYIQAKKIYFPRGKNSLQILSTSKGIMSGQDARKQNIGGEILLEVW